MTSTTNPLATTADRFDQARKAAWLKYPPPCRENPATLPCDCPRTNCDLGLEKSKCKYRQNLVHAIAQQLKK